MRKILFALFIINICCLISLAQTERQPPPIIDPDYYRNLTWNQEKARLDILSIMLQNDEMVIPYIVIEFGKQVSLNKARNRVRRILNYLVVDRKIGKNRIVFALSRGNEETTYYWLISPEEKFNLCPECLIVKGEAFNTSKSSFYQKLL